MLGFFIGGGKLPVHLHARQVDASVAASIDLPLQSSSTGD
jgi:hypothetical protein